MFFLFLSVLSNSMMTLTLKLAAYKKYNSDRILIYNYIVAASGAIINMLSKGLLNRYAEISSVDIKSLFSPDKTAENSIFFVYVCGLVSGVVYLANMLLMKYSIRYNGASITSVFGKTGFVISIAAAVIVWREFPTAAQWAGIALAVVSVVLLFSPGGETIVKRPMALLYMFILSGVIELSSKTFTMYTLAEYKDMLPPVIFSVALILCCIYVHKGQRRSGERFEFKWTEVLMGLCVGLPNAAASFLMLNALRVVSASVYFPTVAAGGLLVVTAVSMLVFKEKLSRKQIAGMIMVILSLVMINLRQ